MQPAYFAQQFFGPLVLDHRGLDGHFDDLIAACVVARVEHTLFAQAEFLAVLGSLGILSSARPSMVGTSIFVPRPASSMRIGTVISMSSPSRRKNGCGSTLTVMYRSPAERRSSGVALACDA